jgi:hypothetical protein
VEPFARGNVSQPVQDLYLVLPTDYPDGFNDDYPASPFYLEVADFKGSKDRTHGDIPCGRHVSLFLSSNSIVQKELTLLFFSGTITSIVRISIFFKRFTTYDLDFTWVGVDIVLWSTVEGGVYLIAACLPSLRPLLNTYLKDFDSNQFRHGIEKFKLTHSRKAGSRDHLPSRAITIPLADPTASRGGFNRIEHQRSRDQWPEDYLGTKPGLATCTRESFDDSQNGSGDLGMRQQRNSEFMGGIVVHKEYTIKTEPVVYDNSRDYVVSR